ncbi:hypothetical protein AK812_SmicGene46603, partial [Symbiodinium microadriaticum]
LGRGSLWKRRRSRRRRLPLRTLQALPDRRAASPTRRRASMFRRL